MNIYKLNYTDNQTAIADLLAKGVYTEVDNKLVYSSGIQSVYNIGLIVKIPPTFDEDGNLLTEPIYYDGVFYDVMCIQDINFGTNEVFPINVEHSYDGY